MAKLTKDSEPQNADEFKGTKGEWVYVNDSPYHRVEVGGERIYVATAVDTHNEVEEIANAKLIAAAPDMLNALIELQKYSGFPAGSYQHGLIVSAIKKATS